MSTPTWLGGGVEGREAWTLQFDPINVLNFGAVGDGVTDDQPVIQACINAAAAPGGTSAVYVPPTENGYYLDTLAISGNNLGGLLNVPAGVKLLGNWTKLRFGNKATPFIVARTPELVANTATIVSDLVATDTNINVDDSSLFTIGDVVLVKLAQSTFDVAEPKWWLYAKVSAVPDGSHVTIDRPVCYPLSVAATPTASQRAVTRLDNFVQDFQIGPFDLIATPGLGNCQGGVVVACARGGIVDVTGEETYPGMFGTQYAEHIEVGMISARRISKRGVGYQGRGIALAESRSITFHNAYFKDCEGPFVWLEEGCRSIKFGTLHVENGYPGRVAGTAILDHYGNVEARYDSIFLTGNYVNLYDTGGDTTSSFDIGSITLGCAEEPYVSATHYSNELDLPIRGLRYKEVRQWSKTFTLTASTTATLSLPSGICRRLRLYPSGTTGITSLKLNNGTSSDAGSIHASLSAGVQFTASTPIDKTGVFVFNNLEPKKIVVITNGSLVLGTSLTVYMDYFVARGVTDDGSLALIQG